MSPSTKFNALIASTTVSLMCFWATKITPSVQQIGAEHGWASSVAGLLVSAGVYRFLALGVRWAMERSNLVRSFVLGPHYLHGTWIGWFRGHAGDLRFTVEHYVQDLDSIVIVGRSYTASGEGHGYWLSDAVAIDAARGTLLFTYTFDVVRRSSQLSGINSSVFERSAAHKAPTKLSGFAHDLNDTERIAVHSEKVSGDLESFDVALAKAMRKFGGAGPDHTKKLAASVSKAVNSAIIYMRKG